MNLCHFPPFLLLPFDDHFIRYPLSCINRIHIGTNCPLQFSPIQICQMLSSSSILVRV